MTYEALGRHFFHIHSENRGIMVHNNLQRRTLLHSVTFHLVMMTRERERDKSLTDVLSVGLLPGMSQNAKYKSLHRVSE